MLTAIDASSRMLSTLVAVSFGGSLILIVLAAILVKITSDTKRLVERLIDDDRAIAGLRPYMDLDLTECPAPVVSEVPAPYPGASAQRPVASAQSPVAPAQRPAASAQYPAEPAQRPVACDQHPAASAPSEPAVPVSEPRPDDFYPEPNSASPAHSSFETWAGRNIIGVIASVLVFMGLAFLGVTVAPQLADWMKAALLFAFSGVLTAGGTALTLFRKNNFTSAVMGCGVGSLFISIFITHLFFRLIGDIAAFALVLVWMMTCLALMRKTSSFLLAVVLQIGLAVSVCLGYWGDADGTRLALMVVYQLVASAIVVIGNSRFNRGAYWASIVLAMALSLVASWFIWDYFGLSQLGWNEAHAPLEPIVAFGIQFVCTTALFGLLTAETVSPKLGAFSRKRKSQSAGEVARHEKRESHGSLAAAAAIWNAAVFVDVTCVASKCICVLAHPVVGRLDSYLGSHIGAVAGFTCVAIVALLFALLERKLSNADENRTFGPVLACLIVGCALIAAVPAVTVIGLFDVAPLTWLWTSALVALAVDRITGTRRFHGLAVACLAIDGWYCCFVSFPLFARPIGPVGAALLGMAYVALLFGITLWIAYRNNPKPPALVAFAAASTVLALSYLSSCTPLATEGYQWSIWCMICALICIVAGFRFDIGSVRLYGIIVVLVSVAKLAILDTAALDSMARVGAFIVGGLICFAISALYNFARKRLE